MWSRVRAATPRQAGLAVWTIKTHLRALQLQHGSVCDERRAAGCCRLLRAEEQCTVKCWWRVTHACGVAGTTLRLAQYWTRQARVRDLCVRYCTVLVFAGFGITA